MEQLPPSRLLSKLKKHHSRDCGFAASFTSLPILLLVSPLEDKTSRELKQQKLSEELHRRKKNKQTQTLE
jgi:hypothetical protein